MVSFRSPLFLTSVVLFFLSGMVGLGYELIWIRKAAQVVGSSQIALSTVLTAFFLGLGIGSHLVGNYLRSRRWSPLFVYGLFEVSIGLFALAFPSLFGLIETAYGTLYPFCAASHVLLFALRFGLIFLLFLVPTIFMGGTLPLLLDGLVERDLTIGSRTSVLYGINILGAVAGVLVTSYWAIPNLGLSGTSYVGATMNVAIGTVAICAFARLRPLHGAPERPALDFFFPAAAFLSGLLAIAYQVAWARYFSLFNTGTVYLTAVLLAVYLLALAAGSFLLAPILAGRVKPLRVLSTVQALIPLFAVLCLEWWRALEYRFSLLGQRLPTGEIVAMDTLEINADYGYFWSFFNEGTDAIFFAPLFQIALVLFIPVTLIGAGLPSIIAASTRHSAGLRSVSGRLLFWNTLGSSAGGFVSGYVLLPFAGLHWTIVFLGLGSLLLSIAAHFKVGGRESAPMAPAGRKERRRDQREEIKRVEVGSAGPGLGSTWAGLVLPSVGLVAALAFAFVRDDITSYTIRYHGYGRDPELGFDPENPGQRRDRSRDPALEVVEGPLTTSFLFEDKKSARLGSGNVCLAVAYKDQPCSQAIQGHLPCLFYPGDGLPEDCLGICLGSGQSFGALLMYPIRQLDVVDISSEIVDLSLRHFGPYNHNLGGDSRVRFHLDDGRHFVERAATDSYDVVSMEPPPPTTEGVSSLYSIEFYEQVTRILRPGGVFMQWLPLYRVTPLDALGIVKTQAHVFPETFVVKAFSDDFMVVSYETRPRFRLDAIRSRLKVFETERLLKGARWNSRCRHDIASLEGVLAFLIEAPGDVKDMTAPMLYRDDTQILNYSSGDRWLLRRYEGPALSPLSFAALKLTAFADLKDYFDPPLAPELAAALDAERAAALGTFRVPDPGDVTARKPALQATRDPSERARLAMELAFLYDGMLAKDEAYGFVEVALAALAAVPATTALEKTEAERQQIARAIVRHAVCAHERLTSSWLARLGAKYYSAPLLEAMRAEWNAYRRREQERLSRYWWP